MLNMLWNSSDYSSGRGSAGHMVLVSEVVSNKDSTESGIYLQVLDPNLGKISWEEHGKWITNVPTRTCRVFDMRSGSVNSV